MLSPKYVCILILAVGVFQCAATQLSAAAYTEGGGQLSHFIFFMTYIGLFSNAFLLPVHAFITRRRNDESEAITSGNEDDESSEDLTTPVVSSAVNIPSMVSSSSTSSTRMKQEQEAEDATQSSSLSSSSSSSQLPPPQPENLLHKISEYPIRFFIVLSSLYLMYVGANGCYTYSLSVGMLPSITASLSAICPVFVVFLSWAILGLQPRIVHWAALVTGVAGVLLILQPWHAPSIFDESKTGRETTLKQTFGIFCAVLSPLFAAVYKVLFAKYFPKSKWYEAGKILGLLTIPNLFLGTILISLVIFVASDMEFNPFEETVIFVVDTQNTTSINNTLTPHHPYYSDEPRIVSLRTIPSFIWLLVGANMVLGLIFNLLVNWGVTVVNPLYIAIGSTISTVGNIFADASLGRGWPHPVAWVGIFLIIVSFLCVSYASSRDTKNKDHQREKKTERNDENTALLESTSLAENKE